VQVWKGAENSSLPGFDPRTVHPVATIPTTLSRPLLLLLLLLVVVVVVVVVVAAAALVASVVELQQ
jgi:hypothetical protein